MDGERAHGPLIDANAFAAVINLCLIPLIYDFLRKVRPFHRSEKTGTLLALGAVTIMTLANLLTFSRGALLTLLIGSTAAIVLQYRNRNLHFGRMLLLILVVITAYTATRSVSYNSASNMLARDLSTIAVVTSPQGASAVDSAWRFGLLPAR
jgi:amino acid transporter